MDHTTNGKPNGQAGRLKEGILIAERFRLKKRIGRGGLGYVWLTEDTHLDDEPVACKILREDFFHDRRAIADLKREVLLTRRLRHPYILAVYTFWESEAYRFISMEYVEGKNLSDALLDRKAPFALHDILPWIKELSEALDFAHNQGVLHRDVKPGNILLNQQNQVCLADFGIARLAREVRTRLTGEMTCGTLMYVSPEQLMGESLDRRSDLYSLAASIYELLAGVPPFYQGSIVTQIQLKPAPPVKHLSDAVNKVLLQALAKDPDQRFASVSDFHAALLEASQHSVVIRSANAETEETTPFFKQEDKTVTLPKRDTAPIRMRLGAVLIGAAIITPQELDKALSKQQEVNRPLGGILIEEKLCNEEDIAHALSRQLNLKYSTLENVEVDADLASMLAPDLAKDRRCIPLHRENETIIVAMADPLDMNTINELEATFHAQVDIQVATESNILKCIQKTYTS